MTGEQTAQHLKTLPATAEQHASNIAVSRGCHGLVGCPCHYALMGVQSSTSAPGVSLLLCFRLSPGRQQSWLLIGLHQGPSVA